MQPRADAAIQLQRMGPSREDEEDRLEGVVGIVSISENSPAGSVHEGAMSVDESRKRVFVALGQKSGEKTRIEVALVRSRPALKYLHQCCYRHRLTSQAEYSLSVYHEYLPAKCESLLENSVNNGFCGFDAPFFLCVLFTSRLFLSASLFANPSAGKELRV